MAQQAIGIIDSGVGGLSVFQAIEKLLPTENLTYIADSKYAPYGEKSKTEIAQRVSTLVDLLHQQDIKALVIACNTATVNLIQQLRQSYSLPIIGVEPGIKPAVAGTKTKKVGVLATAATINSQAFVEFSRKFLPHSELILTPCPKFVPLIEQEKIGSHEAKMAVKEYVLPLIEQGCDQIVLGCTHYPFLKQDIEQVIAGKAQLIDTSQAVAQQVKSVLLAQELINTSTELGQAQYLTTGDPSVANSLFSKLLQKQVLVEAL